MKRKKLTPWSFLLSLLVMLLLSNGEHSSDSYSRLVLAQALASLVPTLKLFTVSLAHSRSRCLAPS